MFRLSSMPSKSPFHALVSVGSARTFAGSRFAFSAGSCANAASEEPNNNAPVRKHVAEHLVTSERFHPIGGHPGVDTNLLPCFDHRRTGSIPSALPTTRAENAQMS